MVHKAPSSSDLAIPARPARQPVPSQPTAKRGGTADSFPSLPRSRGAARRRADDDPKRYFSTKYAPLPWPLENQRLVTVFLRV